VAQEKVAGSSPVGHPLKFRIAKPDTRNRSLLQFAEDPEQRLAGAAEAVIHPPAVAVGLDQLGYSEPGEVGGDRGGAQVELPGELGGSARRGKQALEHARPVLKAASSAVSFDAEDEEVHNFATPRGPYARVGR
jgi:hypothetical protein